MKYTNSAQLTDWLLKSGYSSPGVAAFEIDEHEFNEQRALLAQNNVRGDHLSDRAAFRCLTLNLDHPVQPIPRVDSPSRIIVDFTRMESLLTQVRDAIGSDQEVPPEPSLNLPMILQCAELFFLLIIVVLLVIK